MKLIVAIIKPFKLEAVRAALSDIGVTGMTVSEVLGFGRQHGHTVTYRSAEYQIDFVSKLQIEIAVEDALLDAAIEAVATHARTTRIGDGKLFVLDLANVVRIRTGEKDVDAV